MSKLNNKNVIQWFVCLVRRDMESYAEDKGEKRKLYQLLNGVHREYYLVSLTHHDFTQEHALWDQLLLE